MRTNDQVKHLFAHRQEGSSANLSSDGTVLRSYGTAIAVWHDGAVFISSDGMTPTTASKHLSGLAFACRPSEYLYTPAFRYGRSEAPSVEECLYAAAEEMEARFKTLLRSRVNLDSRIENYIERREQILLLAEKFGIQDPPAMPAATGDLKEKAKELAVKEREARKEQKEAQCRQIEERKERDRKTFNLWIAEGRGHFPSSYAEPSADFLTIRNGRTYDDFNDTKGFASHLNREADTVITSQGAEAPLDHVRKALKFYDSRKYTAVNIHGDEPETAFNEYRTNGHKIHLGAFVLDSIDEQGNVKAGCHTFTAAEIARFREQWREML